MGEPQVGVVGSYGVRDPYRGGAGLVLGVAPGRLAYVGLRWTHDFGSKCLLARRLLERGVRFIQLYSGGGHLEDTWDGHSDCIRNHTPMTTRAGDAADCM